MCEFHTGGNMFALTGKILDVLRQNWKDKIIGVATDGASNMTSCHVGVVTQIERVSNKGFFRIWCAAHQLDLIVKDRFKSMFNDSFVHVIQDNGSFEKTEEFDSKNEINISSIHRLPMAINGTFP